MFTVLGRLAYRRRWLIVGLWIVVLGAGITIGGNVFTHLKDSSGSASAESVRGMKLLDASTRKTTGLVAVVSGVPASAPATRTAVERVSDRVAALPYVESVTTAYNMPEARLVSADGMTSVVSISTAKTDDMMQQVNEVDAVRRIMNGAVPGATVSVGGNLAVMRDQMATSESDLVVGELIALPILLIALFFVFRGWRSALLPLAGAVVTVAGALLLLLAATRIIDVSGYAVDVIALFGLALAVDYSLLMVSRFREERATGAPVSEAVERSVAREGRTIAFSALTVVAALSGLFLFDNPTFTSLAAGGIATVLVALAAGLTLVPALTGIWGHKIKPPKETEITDSGFFHAVASGVQRRPVWVAAGTGTLLLAAALPFFGIRFSNGDYRVLPSSMESRQATDAMLSASPDQAVDPIQVVARVDAVDPRVVSYASTLARLPGVQAVNMEPNVKPGVVVIDVVPPGQSQDEAAQRLVGKIRQDRTAFETLVTGQAASLVDFKQSVSSRLPYVIGFIALATIILLFLMTGSVLVPIKALVMNMLSLGATFGALVWIFQDGHLSGLLGFSSFGTIEVFVPILVFVFGFGLSMDYEVFLLTRIKESYDRSGDSDRAVATGLQRSGRIITSAAALVMIVFLGFVAGQNLGIKEMGLALAIAVAVDATLVRILLVPATMTLLGDANWWSPRPLRRLYNRIGLRDSPSVPRRSHVPV